MVGTYSVDTLNIYDPRMNRSSTSLPDGASFELNTVNKKNKKKKEEYGNNQND